MNEKALLKMIEQEKRRLRAFLKRAYRERAKAQKAIIRDAERHPSDHVTFLIGERMRRYDLRHMPDIHAAEAALVRAATATVENGFIHVHGPKYPGQYAAVLNAELS